MATDTVYKLRHIETGLFYHPKQRGINTSKIGKVYNSKPARQSRLVISKEDALELGLEVRFSSYGRKCELDEWEVVAYKLVECKTK